MRNTYRTSEEKIEMVRLVDQDHAAGMVKSEAMKKHGLSPVNYYSWQKGEKLSQHGGRKPGTINKTKNKPRVLDLLNLGHGGLELEQVKPQSQKQMMLIMGTKDELLQFAKGLQ